MWAYQALMINEARQSGGRGIAGSRFFKDQPIIILNYYSGIWKHDGVLSKLHAS